MHLSFSYVHVPECGHELLSERQCVGRPEASGGLSDLGIRYSEAGVTALCETLDMGVGG